MHGWTVEPTGHLYGVRVQHGEYEVSLMLGKRLTSYVEGTAGAGRHGSRPATIGLSALPGVPLPLFPLKAALMEWFRAAELSCDRAAALVTARPLTICRTLMVIAAGAEAANLDLDVFMRQALDYREKASPFDRLSRLLPDLNLTHPMSGPPCTSWTTAVGLLLVSTTGSSAAPTSLAASLRAPAPRPATPSRTTRSASVRPSGSWATRSRTPASSSATPAPPRQRRRLGAQRVGQAASGRLPATLALTAGKALQRASQHHARIGRVDDLIDLHQPRGAATPRTGG